jgi:hypothetical protein
MAPSRGGVKPAASSSSNASDEFAVDQQSQSALIAAKRNFQYLINPKTQAAHPSGLRTRALLRTVRYITTFILWRLVRYAKFIAVGAAVAAVGATAFGSVITGVAWIAAPTSIAAAIASATVWSVGKWAARRLHRRWEKTGKDQGVRQREERETTPDLALGAVPW